jgi:hypothetical protein
MCTISQDALIDHFFAFAPVPLDDRFPGQTK